MDSVSLKKESVMKGKGVPLCLSVTAVALVALVCMLQADSLPGSVASESSLRNTVAGGRTLVWEGKGSCDASGNCKGSVNVPCTWDACRTGETCGSCTGNNQTWTPDAGSAYTCTEWLHTDACCTVDGKACHTSADPEYPYECITDPAPAGVVAGDRHVC